LGASYPCGECVDGPQADAAPVHLAAPDHLFQLVLNGLDIDAKPDGTSDLIGGRTVWLLRCDDGQYLVSRARCARRRRVVGMLCQGSPAFRLLGASML